MVNAETDSGPDQESIQCLTVFIQKIISQSSQDQEFDGVLKFSEKHLMVSNYTKIFWLTKNMLDK